MATVFCVRAAQGQSVEVRVDPRTLTLDDVAAMQVFLRDPPGRVLPPEVESDDFTVEAIPPAEGRVTPEGIFWRFLLVPIRSGAGKVRLALTVGHQRFEREETLRVREETPSAEPTHREAAAEDLTGRRFVRADVDKHIAYVHEQVTYRFRYYFENWLPTVSGPQYALPAFRGFTSKPLDPSSTPASGRERIGGREYYVEEVRVALFPLTEGEWTIEPTRLVLPPIGKGDKPRELRTERLRVRALPLPPPPTGFSGGVGEFTVRLESPDAEGRVGESLRVRVVVEGRGNIETLTRVPKPHVEGAQLFEPSVHDTVEVMRGVVGGSRVYEYVLTPQQPGTLTVRMPPVQTFDPRAKRYISSEPQSLSLPIRPARAPADQNEARPIRAWRRRAERMLLWLTGAGVVVVWWRMRRRASLGGTKTEEGQKPSPLRVEEIPLGDGRAFCRQLGKMLRQAACERFGWAPSVSSSETLARLDAEGSPEAAQLAALLRECELGEFAPVVLTLAEQESLRNRAATALKSFRAATER